MEEEKQERQVKGIWIPIEIWRDKNLSWNEKILFLEIDSYTSNEKDCFISNEYISNLLGINVTNASKTLSSLIEKGYVVKTRFDGRRRFIKSALSYSTTLNCQKQQPYNDWQELINNNNITNTNTNNKENKKKDELDLSIVAPQMRNVVETWLSYKKEKGQSYKATGFKTFYKKLCKLSGNNPQTAMAIIEESMGNNYAGIFPLKNNNGYGRETITDKIRRTVAEANVFSQQLTERIGNNQQQGNVCDGDSDEVW